MVTRDAITSTFFTGRLQATKSMATLNVPYELLRNSSSSQKPQLQSLHFTPDRMMPVSTMHRMALKASEKIILLMNNTQMLTRHYRLASMNDVLVYLTGNHEDQGMPGDRGDFYCRKLAEQLYVHHGIQNIDHYNVLTFVHGLVGLESDCRNILCQYACQRAEAPPVNVDGQILDIIGRLTGLC